jgi:uncharacterized protein YdhG (YjbR/CyaY superfamily)
MSRLRVRAFSVSVDKVETIDAYLAAVRPDRRRLLQDLRRAIRRAVPAAEECISYGMPAFRVEGGIVAGFAATKDGCSYYPFSGQTLSELASEVAAYEGTKSSLHFSVERPLPATLLRKLVRARLAEIRRAGARSDAARLKPRKTPSV